MEDVCDVKRPPVGPIEPLPTVADDPRLGDGRWYHTIELCRGVYTRNAEFDHRSIVDCVGLPRSLAGKTALDVGTADGFWAFEMERRGADHVVAIDVVKAAEFDILPIHRARKPADWDNLHPHTLINFATAQAMARQPGRFPAPERLQAVPRDGRDVRRCLLRLAPAAPAQSPEGAHQHPLRLSGDGGHRDSWARHGRSGGEDVPGSSLHAVRAPPRGRGQRARLS